MTELTQERDVPTRVECPAAKDPAVRLFIFAAMLIAAGVWCFVDGYVRGLPAKHETINEIATFYFNHVGGILFPLAGLAFLVWGIVFLRRRLLADEEGIGYVGKEKIPWSAFSSVDSSKLASKGVLRLRYESGGLQGTLVLDGWKLQNYRQLVTLVDQKVSAGQARQPPGRP